MIRVCVAVALALLLALIAWPASAQQQITSWQQLAVYVGQQTTKLNELNAKIKAVEAENVALKAKVAALEPKVQGTLTNYALLDADLSMQAGQINRILRYAAYQMCATNARAAALTVVFSWWQPFPLGSIECPTGTVVLPGYLRSSSGRIYGIETLP